MENGPRTAVGQLKRKLVFGQIDLGLKWTANNLQHLPGFNGCAGRQAVDLGQNCGGTW